MMGEWLVDELAIESSHKGKIRGMGLFPVETEFEEEKVRTQTEGRFGELYGCFRELSGKKLPVMRSIWAVQRAVKKNSHCAC